MLIDSHAHLTDDKYSRDRERIIRNLKREGIDIVITSGSSILSSSAAVSLSKKYNNIYATVGIHPNGAGDMDMETLNVIEALSQNNKVVAIGEIGLDYHHNVADKETQKKWFVEQIRLAKTLNLPIVVHDRKANIDTFNIMKDEYGGSLRGVLHCYSGNLELAKKYIEMGFYISIAGPVTYRNATELKRVAKEIPLEYLFVETDAPYLTPGPMGKRRNEPSYVRHVAATIAELKGIPFDIVAKKTTENVKRLFNI